MNEKVPVQLLFFASAKDLAGVSKKEYLLSSITSSTNILEEVSKDYPGLLKLKGSIIVSVNQQYFDFDQEIELLSGDEIAFIPPISGVEVKKEPVSDDDFDVDIVETKIIPLLDHREIKCEIHDSCRRGKNDPTFVQITAKQDEIERRIRAFEERKREELNILNIQQFCMNGVEEEDCARTAAVLLRTNDSTSHVKVTKVNNEWGPQTSIINFGSLGASAASSNIQSDGLEERLGNLEKHLNMYTRERPSTVPVYSRITALEKKVLFLEGLSPEYFNLQNQRVLISNSEEVEEEETEEEEEEEEEYEEEENEMEEEEELEEEKENDKDDLQSSSSELDLELSDDVTVEQLDEAIEKLKMKMKKRRERHQQLDSSGSES